MGQITSENEFIDYLKLMMGNPVVNVEVADGFYFTFSYPNMTGIEMLDALVYYGISAISLDITGSSRNEGARACVSLVPNEMLPELALRLKAFNQAHPIK